jgi:hypothetical protein
MSNVLYPNGAVTVSVPANARIAAYSEGSYQLSELVGYPNFPSTTDIIANVQSGALTTSAFAAAQDVTITSTGIFPVYYEVGTVAVVQALRGQVVQVNPSELNATGALTSAMILGGIVTSTTALAVVATLPTGAVLDAASTFNVNDAFDFSVINTGGDIFTVTAAASGHTVVGNMDVADGATGLFRTRKTAANTFVTYSLSNT